jgi:hypothetical protein
MLGNVSDLWVKKNRISDEKQTRKNRNRRHSSFLLFAHLQNQKENKKKRQETDGKRTGLPHIVVYDINSWRDENNKEIPVVRQFSKHPLTPLSVAYQYNMYNKKEWAMLSNREAGNKWALCAINVPNPAAATAWFQSHTGKGWEYSFGFTNCSIFAMEGLAAGGAKIYHAGVNPAPSSVNSEPTMYWQFPAKP